MKQKISACVAVLVVAGGLLTIGTHGTSEAAIQGVRMVGIGSPADSVMRSPDFCSETGTYSQTPGFTVWNFPYPELDTVNDDMDLFYSQTFNLSPQTYVDNEQLASIVRTFRKLPRQADSS